MDVEEEDQPSRVSILFESDSPSCATFHLHKEDHTLGNVLRYALVKNPDVEFAGYTIPHPSEEVVYLRVQTVSEDIPAIKTLNKAISDVKNMTTHFSSEYEKALAIWRKQHP